MSDKVEKLVENIDQNKRASVKKLVTMAAFTAPVISTFSIGGKMNAAFAGVSNTTAS